MKILLVEDEKITRLALANTLTREGHDVVACESGVDGLARLSQERFDVVLTDLRLPEVSGMEILRAARERDPDSVVIIMTAFATVETAVEALKIGAYDYITKPFSPEKVLNLLVKVGELREVRSENTILRRRLERYESREIVGGSAAMRTLLDTVRVIAARECTVLIEGESGTGKELVARALHDASARRLGPFVPIACAAIPETLLESELFGHERGSFSGAVSRHAGYFERANGGTAFIDDIDDLPLAMQVKLLRAVQEHEFLRVGGDAPLKLDIRIVCATKLDLLQLVRAGRFRDDLYYRLNIVPLRLPPLRERAEDIPALAEHFLTKHGAPEAARNRVAELLPLMTRHAWPGNVRELENVIQRIIALPGIADPGLRSADDGARPPAPPPSPEGPTSPVQYEKYMEHVDRELIGWALARAGNRISGAASLLGLPRTTLRSKMDKYGIHAPREAG
jgi:DNA-binding NtrC family response regulator